MSKGRNKKAIKDVYRVPKLYKSQIKIYASLRNFDRTLLAEFTSG